MSSEGEVLSSGMPVNYRDASDSLIKDYTIRNFVGFLFSSFSTISFVVFITATQTYFMTDVLGVSKDLGSYVGTLGFYDELLAIVLVPFVGTLSDKIGSRPIQVFGAFVMGLSFLGYGAFARSIYPGMLFWRLVFCIGAASATGTMVVMLIELNKSNFQLTKSSYSQPMGLDEDVAFNSDPIESPMTQEEVNKINSRKKEGKRSSLMGISSGLGAIFAVSVYLKLPVTFGESTPPSGAMIKSYYTVGVIAIVTAVVLFFTLYKDDKKKMFMDEVDQFFDDLEEDETIEGSGPLSVRPNKELYLTTLKTGFSISAQNPVILMSYLGSFMARITTVVVSVFIPFYINNYFFKSGICSTHDLDKVHCRESYILSSILTGISQTVGLILAPLVGILIDRLNNHLHVLLLGNTFSMISTIGLCLISKPDESKMIYLWVSFLGVSQIIFILASMTLLSNINSKEVYYRYKGSISGVYSLFGGVGILLMNKIGGLFGDWFLSGPFIMLFLCNMIFFILMILLKATKENQERSFKSIATFLRHKILRF